MAGPNVVVLGDACVDMVIQLPDRSTGLPDLTKSIPQLSGGGSAANVAVALTRLGIPVKMIGTIGDDSYGKWIRDDLAGEGVDIHEIQFVTNAFTPMVMALIEPDGERLNLVWPPEGGSHFHLRTEMINQSVISASNWLHTSGICLREVPGREAVLHAMELARESKVTVSLDLNLRLELWGMDSETHKIFERAIALSDIVFGNASEEIIPMAGLDSLELAAKSICNEKRNVVARQGKMGALVVTPKEIFHIPAIKTQVVDTLGAGDAFNAGFIAACMSRLSLKEAARWGNAVAAYKIGKSGARGLPFLKDLKTML